jgi:NAD(P)H-dependent FMN reductase
MPRIIVFAGSTRRASWNKMLARLCARLAADAGADVTWRDLRDRPLPLYDGDLEEAEGVPAHAAWLKELFREHQGFLLASPEYNSSITGVLKNTIDWMSRPLPPHRPLESFLGMVAGLVSASPGALGGLRALVHVRAILSNIGVLVVPQQLAVPLVHRAFDADGELVDEAVAGRLRGVVEALVETTRKLAVGNAEP